MPSTSIAQQRLMGQAYALKTGELKSSDLDPKYRKQIEDLADSMSEKDLKDFAETSHKGLPQKVKENYKMNRHVPTFESFINESIDRLELDEAIKIKSGTGPFYKYTRDHKLIEKIFNEAFNGQEDKLHSAKFFNTGAPCIRFELKDRSDWMLIYYPGQTYLEDHGLGSISLYPYGPQEKRYEIFSVGVKGNRKFGDTKMTPAELRDATNELKDWASKQ